VRFRILFTWFVLICVPSSAQELPVAAEQQFESLADIGEAEAEDDAYLQQLEYLTRQPLNLNTADERSLQEMGMLTDLQIGHLISYRKLLGPLLSIYELQAIPSWDLATIKKVLPFVTIKTAQPIGEAFFNRVKTGEHSLIMRYGQILERAKGFSRGEGGTKYEGGPQRFFFRYRYNYKNLLQAGILGDKDAGEPFFQGAQKFGFDFYTFHVFARKLGIVEALAVGDFTVNMGQGLIQWQSLAFRKSGETMLIKRQSAVLRPYTSAGEVNYNRGIAATLKKKNAELTFFASHRKMSANLEANPISGEPQITSIPVSGYHRTPGEIADRANSFQQTIGSVARIQTPGRHLAANVVYHRFGHPFQQKDDPYRSYAISGDHWFNASMDYSYTYKNLHFFGESAVDRRRSTAFLHGLLVSLDARLDASFLHRSIQAKYQAVQANAFTENTSPSNENGFYAGLSFRPSPNLKLDGYIDLFRFPWLKFQVDAPSDGRESLVQVHYTPSKKMELQARFREEQKLVNVPGNRNPLNKIETRFRRSFRIQLNYSPGTDFTFRQRLESLWLHSASIRPEQGYLVYFDLLYRPRFKPYGAVMRVQYFETDSYNSRLYAFESDLLYNYSLGVFYDKGYRYYLTLYYQFTENWTCWVRFARLQNFDKSVIGSGPDELQSNKKTELRVQLRWRI
jgi:hypothetical protein